MDGDGENSEPVGSTYKDIDKSAVEERMEELSENTTFPPPRDFKKNPIREDEISEVRGGFSFTDKTGPNDETLSWPTRLDQSPEFRAFNESKVVTFKGGPFDGANWAGRLTDESGLLYFFREVRGEIEQCVYRIVLKEREKPLLAAEASDEDKAAWRAIPKAYDWVGDYVGKRKCPVPTVNGIRGTSPQRAG